MTNDKIKITILEDGTIRVETDQVGQANHMSADNFLKMMAQLAGGPTMVTKKGAGLHHHHHDHEHEEHSH